MLGDEWDPAKANMMIYAQGPQITVLVDPAYPDAWKMEPYGSQLRQWAKDVEQTGGYIIVFVGDDVFKVEGIPYVNQGFDQRLPNQYEAKACRSE